MKIIKSILHPIANYFRKIAKKNKMVKFIGKIIRRANSKHFRDYVCNYKAPAPAPKPKAKQPSDKPLPLSTPRVPSTNHRVRSIAIHEVGDKNYGDIVMLTKKYGGYAGMCCEVMYFLNRLALSQRLGVKHCILWYNVDSYEENEPVNGRTNVFEYYFQQPYGISYDEAEESQALIYDYLVGYGDKPGLECDDVFRTGGYKNYFYTDEDVRGLAKIYKKYMHLQPEVEDLISNGIKDLFKNDKVIGVHARGTDYNIGYKNHPKAVTIERYLSETHEMLEETGATKVFLATDDKTIVEAFSKEFGDQLLYYSDVHRTEGDEWNCFADNPNRKHHRYLLGVEILRDVYTLASCSGLICSLSNVGFFSRIVRLAINDEYESIRWLRTELQQDGVDLHDPKARDKIRDKWNSNHCENGCECK